MPERCTNCDATIGNLETPFVWRENVVCDICFRRLNQHAAIKPVAEPPRVSRVPPSPQADQLDLTTIAIPRRPIPPDANHKQCPKCKEWMNKSFTKCPHCRTVQRASPSAIAIVFFFISALFLIAVVIFSSNWGKPTSPEVSSPPNSRSTKVESGQLEPGKPESGSAFAHNSPAQEDEWREASQRQEAAAKALGQPKEMTLDLGNKVTMKLVLIPAGKFIMGSPESEQREAAKAAALAGYNDALAALAKANAKTEGPQHQVRISKPFYMGVYDVTQEQWEAVMGTTLTQQRDRAGKSLTLPGAGKNYPMYYVSWNEVMEFCRKVSAKTGKKVRLPTEAEWEYACRAGSKTRFDFGNNDTDLGDHAWYTGNSDDKTHPVGQKKPNAWGLYDMLGNVSQWCSDYYMDSYADAKDTDPQGPASGTERVARGGSWFDEQWDCKSASRNCPAPEGRDFRIGFRVSVGLGQE